MFLSNVLYSPTRQNGGIIQITTVYFSIQHLYQLTLYNHKAVLRHGMFEVFVSVSRLYGCLYYGAM